MKIRIIHMVVFKCDNVVFLCLIKMISLIINVDNFTGIPIHNFSFVIPKSQGQGPGCGYLMCHVQETLISWVASCCKCIK